MNGQHMQRAKRRRTGVDGSHFQRRIAARHDELNCQRQRHEEGDGIAGNILGAGRGSRHDHDSEQRDGTRQQDARLGALPDPDQGDAGRDKWHRRIYDHDVGNRRELEGDRRSCPSKRRPTGIAKRPGLPIARTARIVCCRFWTMTTSARESAANSDRHASMVQTSRSSSRTKSPAVLHSTAAAVTSTSP